MVTPVVGAPRTVMSTDRTCSLESGEAATGTTIAVRQIGTFGESLPALFTIP